MEHLTVGITRRATFAAAHVLRRHDWSEERNREVFGGCAGEHGHNYTLEVTVSGPVDPPTGMVLNLKDLDRVLRDAVIEHVDHKHLNRDVAFLEGVMPTAENLALAFWREIEAGLGAGRLRKVRLVESENNAAEVTAE
ncbi:MAG TPA: 6-carboxytetrahydropterin synthase [Candidatus Dormibacteraeota bacterium]